MPKFMVLTNTISSFAYAKPSCGMSDIFPILSLVLYNIYNRISGDDSKEDPPVPMPNTAVKLFYVEDTWWVTAWENR